ncbi:MAG: hypothetical protein GY859_33060 [Desulfobacterales bacterium]|nr:hypothetical protein [Desulfobacterales bacterium]
MNTAKKIFILIMVLMAVSVGNALGNDESSKGRPGGRQGPPPEAYTACEGKSAGDAAQFTNPRGETVSGTCEEKGDRLVLRPDHRGGNSKGGRQGPPPEAYTACEDKSAGDAAQFENPRGETVSGTCEQVGDKLVLRPDHRGGNAGGSRGKKKSDD